MTDIASLVIQIGVIIGAARLVGTIFRKIGQPQVMGEMVAGILLGPTLLGWAAPRAFSSLFPPSNLSLLNALSQVGLVIYMFLVGLGINPAELRKQGHAAVLTSHVSITAPFVMATVLAMYLYPRLSDNRVSFTSFALFMGAAMSITAFPVLARILTDRDMLHSRLGTIAISCAAVDDVTGWCVLAYIVVLVRAAKVTTPVWITLAGLIVFVLVMVYGVARIMSRLASMYRREGYLSDTALAVVMLFLLTSAYISEQLGMHLLFGAFLAGAIMPKDEDFVRYIINKLQFIPVVILLPLFFALTGLRTSIGVMRGPTMWIYCVAIIAVAILGKLGGSMVAASIAGMPLRDAAGLGILMNTRGLMELVILNIGRDLGVISPALFSMMVFMALITTFMTAPLLEFIYPVRLILFESVPVRRHVEEQRIRVAAN